MTLAERFWAKVDQDGPVPSERPDLGPCWLWTAATDGRGYGVIGTVAKKVDKAYRVAYRLLVGPIPEGLELDHLCRVTLCVRPTHLEPVTHAENMRRAAEGGRLLRGATDSHGHPYDEVDSSGWRRCSICRKAKAREATRRWRERKAAA